MKIIKLLRTNSFKLFLYVEGQMELFREIKLVQGTKVLAESISTETRSFDCFYMYIKTFVMV